MADKLPQPAARVEGAGDGDGAVPHLGGEQLGSDEARGQATHGWGWVDLMTRKLLGVGRDVGEGWAMVPQLCVALTAGTAGSLGTTRGGTNIRPQLCN